MIDIVAAPLLVLGALFFLAGTLGLLRFPDAHSRLHALAKADNLGLGFIAVGLALRAGSIAIAAKILLIWVVALIGSAAVSFLIARAALQDAAGAEGLR